ncbi:MAG: DUF4280 domain-containing protein [Flavobacteriaceae bacterium]|nr:DUF4280 domain-containing protein [Flavobacteriaceae bacterium]
MGKNYVCNGATIECKQCIKPEGTLMVTSNEIKIQDKLFATEGDKEKTNLIFEGNCKKSPYQSYPCVSVIATSKWENTADALIQDQKALLENSTIMCTYGGEEIKITDDLQINEPTELQPLLAPVILPVEEPQYTTIEWLDIEGANIKENNKDALHKVSLTTLNFLPGEIITLNISEKGKENIDEVAYYSTVDPNGKAVIELQNVAQKTQKKEVEAPQIEEMYWLDIDGEKIETAIKGESISLFLKVKNIVEGEEITINLDNQKNERTTLTGIVDNKGVIILKNT